VDGGVDRLDVLARVAAARDHLEANLRRLDESRSRLATTRLEIANDRSDRQHMHDSAFGHLQARLESLPAIEQAKGIVMAQTGCRPDEAFDILRRASLRSNVKVRDLAADIVRGASQRDRPAPDGKARPGVAPDCTRAGRRPAPRAQADTESRH
jgi:hypothetical protein